MFRVRLGLVPRLQLLFPARAEYLLSLLRSDQKIARSTFFFMQKLSSVLLIDDDPTTNFLNERLLTNLGVTDHFLVATNGQEALDLLAQACAPGSSTCPALVLLDINMPIMNGIEFLEAYHPRPPAPPFVIIILTTSMHPRDLTRIGSLPIAGLINKPFTREKINMIMQSHFQRQLPD